MNVQKTSWGEVRWQDDEAKVYKNRRLQIGEVHVNAKNHQARHLHYDEQVIYCLSGEAISAINGKESHIRPGDILHYPAGVEHEVWVLKDEPLVHMLVSNPLDVGNDAPFAAEEREDIDPDLFYVAVEAVRKQFLESMNYSYAIFDNLGNLVCQSDRFPDLCVSKCNPGDNPGMCACMRHLSPENCDNQQTFTCPYDMEVLHNPVLFKGHFIGYIQGGYFFHSGQANSDEDLYDVPESVVTGVGALLRRIVKAIRNYCEFEQYRLELNKKELEIASGEQKQSLMLTDLRKAQKEVTDLKINNHFLFNTLNQMASMAIEGGQIELYQSIVNLSKMFHYTLRTQSQMVSLSKEIEYVDAYLDLQKLRYGNLLEVEKDVNIDILTYEVPFNFLQPIVENAFIHGFHSDTKKWIRIEGKKSEHGIIVKIINSGKSLKKHEIKSINCAIESNISHGLSMINQKLKACAGGKSKITAGLDSHGRTCFTIVLER